MDIKFVSGAAIGGVNLSEMEERAERSKRKKKVVRNRVIAAILLLMVFLASIGLSYYLFNKFFVKKKTAGGRPIESGMMVAEDKMTVMIMGVDRREDDVGRSDTLMVATVDPEKRSVAILSIPRDTRVKIRGHGYDKINHAYAYGGHSLTQETVEGLLGAPVDHYVLIDTHAFEKIIDSIGGVDINVEKDMYYEDPWDSDGGLVIDLERGLQRLDGNKAMQYVRYRDEEGDIGRIARQQHFIRAVMSEITSPGIIPRLPSIVKEIDEAIDTDLTISQMVGLAGVVREARNFGVNSEMLPGRPAFISDISYWLPDVVELRRTLANLLDIQIDDTIVQAMQQEAKEYESSIPDEMTVLEPLENLPSSRTEEPEEPVDEEADSPRKRDVQTKIKSTNPVRTVKPSAESEKTAEREEPVKDGGEAATEPQRPLNLQIEVVDASGISGAGAAVAASLRQQGLVVTGVSTLTAPYRNTIVIVNEPRALEQLADLPFRYRAQINKNGSDAEQVTIVVGKDYR